MVSMTADGLQCLTKETLKLSARDKVSLSIVLSLAAFGSCFSETLCALAFLIADHRL